VYIFVVAKHVIAALAYSLVGKTMRALPIRPLRSFYHDANGVVAWAHPNSARTLELPAQLLRVRYPLEIG
jgi:hypothetical protein